MWQGWVNGVIGLWLVVSGIVGPGMYAQWNYIIAGLTLGSPWVLAGQNLAKPGLGYSGRVVTRMWNCARRP